jgi:hypothetical protein
VSAKTPAKEAAVVVKEKTISLAARASAPPRKSEMAMAELLKSSLSLVDRASVITLRHG